MNKRHIHNHGFRLIVAVLLMTLMMAGHASAGVKVKGNVYGGGALANTNTDNWNETTDGWAEGKTSASNTTAVNLTGGTIKGDAYGGGESSYVTGADHTVTVKLQGDTEVLGSVFGGGDKGLVEGSTIVNVEQ